MKISMLGGLMLAAVVTVLVCADEVELNDGAVYQGEIIAESDAEVVIRTARGEKRLARRDVAAVRRDRREAAAAPSDEPVYEISLKKPHVSEVAASKAGDFLSAPDWGLQIEAGDRQVGLIAIDTGGSGCFEAPVGVGLTARLVDIDLQNHDVLTDAVPLEVARGRHVLAFPDGSSVEVIAIDAHDADHASGPDARPEGAGRIAYGTGVIDALEFSAGDRTDCWRLPASTRAVEGFVHATGEVLPRAQWPGGATPQVIEAGGGMPIQEHYVFRLTRVPEGAVLQLRARPWQSAIDYRVICVEVGADGAGRERLIQAMLEEAAAVPEDQPIPIDAEHARMASALDCPAVRRAVRENLRHDNTVARATAVECAAALKLVEALPELRELAKQDPAELVRLAASRAVDSLGR